jgi:hypothetical protein
MGRDWHHLDIFVRIQRRAVPFVGEPRGYLVDFEGHNQGKALFHFS